ncbi:MAG: hypothetical protein HDT21_03550 [Ruminococcus sp.]|nr:hypothetical protein [Ruminococcus sp.]
MRKDILLKNWCKKIRYYDEYEIKIGAMLSYDGEEIVLECFADLYADGELEETHVLDLITERIDIESRFKILDGIEKMPKNMKRKAKNFYEYFKKCDTFKNNISFNEEIIFV